MTFPIVRRGKESVVLVAVLMAVGLMALLVIAFFSQATLNRKISFSSSGQIRAGVVSQAALAAVVGDLFDEIEANSTHPAGSSTIYLPQPGAFMPATSGVSGVPNVLKISTTKPFWPSGGQGRASAVPTTTPALDGRYIDARRWSLPQLSPNLNVVPDWIYVGRGGISTNGSALASPASLANPATTNASFVVGRFSYIIYDEGAGLDVNVAGHHTDSTAPPAIDLANRGNEGFADLTQVGLTSEEVDALVSVRNPASGASGALYLNYLLGIDTNNAAGSYLPLTNAAAPRYGDAAGFMTNFPGDQGFVGRMDFLRFAKNHGITDPAVLSCFTTFTREKNAPVPAVPPGAASDTKFVFPRTALSSLTIGGVDPVGKSYGAIPVYSADAKINASATYSGTLLFTDVDVPVKAGDPVLRRRFPLTRLGWVGSAGSTNGATASDVSLAFGLQWNATTLDWSYQAQCISPATGGIMDLNEVAAQKRDPNFFELLQAGLKRQTLGQAFYPGTDTFPRYFADLNTALHVLQIGANIIDEADADSIPTRIRFVAPGSGSVNSATYSAIGIENIPYPSRVIYYAQRDMTPPNKTATVPASPAMLCGPASGSGVVAPSTAPPLMSTGAINPDWAYTYPWVKGWFGFEVWNPNQPSPAPAAAGNPATLRAIMANTTQIGIQASFPMNYKAGEYKYKVGSPLALLPLAGDWGGNGYAVFQAAQSVYSGNIYKDSDIDYLTPGLGAPPLPSTSGTIKSELDFPMAVASFREATFLTKNSGASSPNANDQYVSSSDTLIGISSGKVIAPDIVFNPNQPLTAKPELMRIDSAGNVQPFTPPYIPDTVAYPGASPNPQDPNSNDPLIGSWSNASSYGGVSQTPVQVFLFQYKSAGGSWITYNTLEGGSMANAGNVMIAPITNTNAPGATIPLADNSLNAFLRADSRVGRFGPTTAPSCGPLTTTNTTLLNQHGQFPLGQPIWPPASPTGPVTAGSCISPMGYTGSTNAVGTNIWVNAGGYAAAGKEPVGALALNDSTKYPAYTDGDGVVRPGDYFYGGGDIKSTPYAPNSSFGIGVNLQRPVILDRPLRSAAEFGYANRDLPWRSVDFAWNDARNADAALLDYFTASDAPVVAGKVSGATRNPLVWKALLAGAAIDPLYATNNAVNGTITPAMAASFASAITNYLGASNVLTNKSDLVVNVPLSTSADAWSGLTGAGVPYPKSAAFQREGPIRALSEPLNTRTWNLMIDVIAQSGRLPLGATVVDKFVVEGERRYWLHIAIDRYTKQIVDSYLEPVYE